MEVTAGAALDRLRGMAASDGLRDFCEPHAITLLVAFGSATDADRAHVARDLDVAVRFARDTDADVVAVTMDLADALGYAPVDVMDLDRASVVARHRALVGTLPLYEAEPGLFATTQMAAILAYMDTAWLRRLDLRLMAESS